MPMIFHGIAMALVCLMGLGILSTGFWIWMLVSCALNKKISDGQKIAWTLIILFTHFIGALIYFFVRGSLERPQQSSSPAYYEQPQRSQSNYSPPYNPYEQGYQAPPPSAQPTYHTEFPTSPPQEQHATLDYEQPQAMYPHEQNDQ